AVAQVEISVCDRSGSASRPVLHRVVALLKWCFSVTLMCSAKVFLFASMLKFGGNQLLNCRVEFEKSWFQRVDRLRKTAILAAEMKYGGERGIRTPDTRK